ncbi:MAG: uroporphyrinogen decarboxylase family protein, partial [FCB group bacterium]|nr:uroporphyrinogen decarboxylase family protein [FCB group bacterium]
PEGDRSAPSSGRMPKDGFYFDTIVRQEPIDDARLRVEDNLEEFVPVTPEELERYRTESDRLYKTGRAILANFGGTAFGDIALVPAPWLKNPRGIRDIAEWYMSTAMRRDHVYQIFERQCEIALANWEKIHAVVGNKVAAVFVTGTDFGTQHGPFISVDAYRDLFKPFHKAVNDWVHKNTAWKTFIHSCGSVRAFLDDFIDAGFDILNPVQCSAAEMGAQALKDRYGDRLTFWGGGVDTQNTLPFGTRGDVENEVRDRIRIFGKDGGFIFNTVHNVQAAVPAENLVALYESLKQNGQYPQQ